jgi:hypothetical protein
VLVATDSVADSAALAARFEARGMAVAVLDARHDHDEQQHARLQQRRALPLRRPAAGALPLRAAERERD